MDNREQILTRLLAVAQSVPDIRSATRNHVVESETRLPAIVLVDGDEETSPENFGRGRPITAPVLTWMRPELHILIIANRAEVGPKLNLLRRRLIRAVLGDEGLRGLCANGAMRYEGCVTAFANGRALAGEMQVIFAFQYLLTPAEP